MNNLADLFSGKTCVQVVHQTSAVKCLLYLATGVLVLVGSAAAYAYYLGQRHAEAEKQDSERKASQLAQLLGALKEGDASPAKKAGENGKPAEDRDREKNEKSGAVQKLLEENAEKPEVPNPDNMPEDGVLGLRPARPAPFGTITSQQRKRLPFGFDESHPDAIDEQTATAVGWNNLTDGNRRYLTARALGLLRTSLNDNRRLHQIIMERWKLAPASIQKVKGQLASFSDRLKAAVKEVEEAQKNEKTEHGSNQPNIEDVVMKHGDLFFQVRRFHAKVLTRR
jgi:hypothetical protein